MQSLNVVLLPGDSAIVQSLVSALSKSFRSVQTVGSVGELRTNIAKKRAGVAILDMEKASISDVQHLSKEFPGARIVCTHRCADEELWAATLNAGAADLCSSDDARAILHAAVNSTLTARSIAA